MKDPMDRLIEEALTTGSVPERATSAERPEVEAALEAAHLLRASGAQVDKEAASSLPTARARFERYLAGAPAPAHSPEARPSHSFWGRLLSQRRLLLAGGLASLVVLVALAAIAGPELLGDGVETANAQVLQTGDYVQVQGVVSQVTDANGGRQLVIESGFGPVTIDVPEGTGGGEADGPKPGDSVAVAGVAASPHRVSASTVARTTAFPSPRQSAVTFLRRLERDLEGRVLTFTLAPDGEGGRVLIEASDGRRLLVAVDSRSAERLLFLSRLLGAEVRVTKSTAAGAAGTFTLEVTSEPSGEEPGALRFGGIVTRHAGDVLTVATARGPVLVQLSDTTRILPGPSGLTRQQIRRGAGVDGHTIAVSGGVDRARGVILADVIVLGQDRGTR